MRPRRKGDTKTAGKAGRESVSQGDSREKRMNAATAMTQGFGRRTADA